MRGLIAAGWKLSGARTLDRACAPPTARLRLQVGHDVLDAGVVLEAVHGEVLAVAGVLEPAVGHLGDDGDVRVDPDAPEVQPPAYPHRPPVILREDAGGEAVADAVGPLYRLVLVAEGLDGDDGAEDLVLRGLVILPEAGDDGRGVVVAGAGAGLLPAGGHLGVLGEPLDHAGDVLELGRVVERSVEDVLVVGPAGLGVPGLLGEGGYEVVVGAGGRGGAGRGG